MLFEKLWELLKFQLCTETKELTCYACYHVPEFVERETMHVHFYEREFLSEFLMELKGLGTICKSKEFPAHQK